MVDVVKDDENAASNVQDNAYGNTDLSDEKISELVDAFINALPIMLKTQLQAA